MGIKELADLVVKKHPAMPVGRVSLVLRAALEALHEELATTEETVVRLGPLGNFKIVTKVVDNPSDRAADAASTGQGPKVARRISLHLTGSKVATTVAEPKAKPAAPLGLRKIPAKPAAPAKSLGLDNEQ